MEYRKALRELREGRIKPYYVCYGTESYLIDDFIERLIAALMEPEHREMGLVRFSTSENPLDEIVDEAETPPFLVPSKLVVVRDSVVFASGRDSAKVEHRPERLQGYMSGPLDSTVLLFVVPHEKLDERKKLVKYAKDKDAVVSFAPMAAEELSQWAIRRAEGQKRRMEQGAVDELLRRVGSEMGAIAAEIDKLCLHAGEGGTVTAEAVATLVSASTEQSVFKLTEEIAALRTDRALALYYDLLKQREEPIKLTALLVRQFRNMLLVKELRKQGFTPQQMAGQLGLHPYAAKITAEQARGFSLERLAAVLERLAELDYEMKTGRVEKTLGLELFLLRTGSEGGG
ncbi:DNA polymerase III subunit delta [Cohnella zeiphila]|uniref:DNA polymerase III subunit delta n=1 Tax=Cohnella zeiphila TaxID=2761120 RepID=A0A7X0VVD4_9BACL|nr:DNA polymerase III subunit delta [Cohnella zeiphila]MBB6729758.1 DNA polymerase III subunit delta [Cohnella zeiphila]